jgi:carbamoyl-phosphate synthase large subunit
MDVLITSASRKVGLVKAFKRALSQEDGGNVIAIDASPRSAALYFADRSYVVPQGLGEDFLNSVQTICHKHDVKLLIPTRDEELPVFAAIKNAMRHYGVTIMVPDHHVVDICRDKRLFLEFCLENGFSIPRTYSLEEISMISEFPIFIKERFGKGSKNIFIAKSGDDLIYLLRRISEPIIQECIDAKEFTVDLFADFSGRVISVVPRERMSILSGESFVGRTCKNWSIINESVRLARALGLVGHNTIQCFWHNGSVKFIEVNPRYGGAANLGFAAGAFTPLYLVRLIMNKEVNPVIGEFKDGYYMLRYTKDVFLKEREVNQLERYNQSGTV